MEDLHLSHCNISEIHGTPFSHLKDLARLYLDHNNLDDDDMANALAPLPLLQTFQASANSLSRFPDLSGTRFPSLIYVYLVENRIVKVQREQLRNMKHLKVLNLKSNYRLSKFNEDALSEAPRLTELNVAYSQIAYLPSLKNASGLQLIHASNSRIEAIPDDLCEHSPELNELDMAYNRITSIPPLSRCRNLATVILNNNQISGLHRDTFARLRALIVLKLEYNRIRSLPDGVFRDLFNLLYLHLDRNYIQELPRGIFQNSPMLERLEMSHNRVRELNRDLFKNNTVLEFVDFDYNDIRKIHSSTFPQDMVHLQVLRLSFNDFDSFHVPPGGFPNLLELGLADLYGLYQVPSQSEIPNIQELSLTYSYHCCIWEDWIRDDLKDPSDSSANVSVESYYPTNEPVTLPTNIVPVAPSLEECTQSHQISEEFLNHLKQMQEFFNITFVVLPNCDVDISFPWDRNDEDTYHGPDPFETARNKPPPVLPEWAPIKCLPRPTGLTPCENLMDPWLLRIAIWAVWVLAVLGNATVLFVTIMAREKFEVPQLLICNLAVADFCLGVYLAFLAVVDVRTYGEHSFYQSALDWQLGSGCKTAGWIAVFSSELSVFMLVTLTLERLHTIAYAFNRNEQKRKGVAITVVVGSWLCAAFLATLPLVGVNSYTQVAVCLPFVTESTHDKAYIGSILSLNLLAFLIILACYSYIFLQIRKSPLANQNKKEVYGAAVKIAVLILTTFFCWFPLAVIGFAALDGKSLVTAGQAKYFVVFVYPLNACVNPFVYAIFTRQFRQRVWSIFKRTKSKVPAFPGPSALRIQRMSNPEGSSRPRGSSNVPPSPDELQRLRWSRRANSLSVQLVDASTFKSPTPPMPGSARTGRRASLPAVFGSTVHSALSSPDNLRASARLTPAERGGACLTPNYSLPFRLGQMYSTHNNSLPNLVEEDEEEDEFGAVAGSNVALSGSQVSSDSGFRRLSIVNEEPAELQEEEKGGGTSTASSDSEDYSDAQDRSPSPVSEFVDSLPVHVLTVPARDLPMDLLPGSSSSLNATAVRPLGELLTESACGTEVALYNGCRDSGHVTMHNSSHTTPRSNSTSSCEDDSSHAPQEPPAALNRHCCVDSYDSTELPGHLSSTTAESTKHSSNSSISSSSSNSSSSNSSSTNIKLKSRGRYSGDTESRTTTDRPIHNPTSSRYTHVRTSSLDALLNTRQSCSSADNCSNRSRGSQEIRIENPNFQSSLSNLGSETDV